MAEHHLGRLWLYPQVSDKVEKSCLWQNDVGYLSGATDGGQGLWYWHLGPML
jgi:hypothetical protein